MHSFSKALWTSNKKHTTPNVALRVIEAVHSCWNRFLHTYIPIDVADKKMYTLIRNAANDWKCEEERMAPALDQRLEVKSIKIAYLVEMDIPIHCCSLTPAHVSWVLLAKNYKPQAT